MLYCSLTQTAYVDDNYLVMLYVVCKFIHLFMNICKALKVCQKYLEGIPVHTCNLTNLSGYKCLDMYQLHTQWQPVSNHM